MTSRPLEILHVMPTLGEGGAEKNLLTLLQQLPTDRYRNHLAWLGGDEALLDSFRPLCASLIRLEAPRRSQHPRAAVTLAGWIRRNDPDVVHTQLLDAQIIARVAALLGRRCPVVTTWQNDIYHDVGPFRGSRLVRGLMRATDLVTGFDDRRFIAVSEHVASELSRQLVVSRDRVSVIYNSLDPSRYRKVEAETIARTRRDLGLADDDVVLLSVARLVPQKGHVDLLAAMPEILREVPKAVLLVAGRGHLADELKARASELGLGDRVRFLGVRRDVPALYQLADAFVFPSYHEGLAVALLEALSNDLAAVVSDIPQNREVADGFESVRFIKPGDPGSIARGTIDILRKRDLVRDAARAGGERIRERFASAPLAHRFGETLAAAASSA